MSCNSEISGSALTTTQLLIQAASDDLRKHYHDIEEAFKSMNLRMTPLIINTIPTTSTVDIEALEVEVQTIITRIDTLMPSCKSTMDKLPVPVAINLFIANGGAEDQAEEWAQAEVERHKDQYKNWEARLFAGKTAFAKGQMKPRGWIALRQEMIAMFGEEKVMANTTWA